MRRFVATGLQEIASKHQVHPNQVSTWKRQAIDGPKCFRTGASAAAGHESEIRDLHAIGELRWSGIFCLEGPVDEPGREANDHDTQPPGAELEPSMAVCCRSGAPRSITACKGQSPDPGLRRIDELFLKYPFYGARQMVRHTPRGRACRRRAGRDAPDGASGDLPPRISDPHPSTGSTASAQGKMIERANHVWCADSTYVAVRRGFLYLVAIMDWASRHVLAWRSNTLDAGFCTDALDAALARHGRRDLQYHQGGQFTASPSPGLRDRHPDLDGRQGRWTTFMSLALAQIRGRYLRELAAAEAQRVIGEWIDFYNTERPHRRSGEKRRPRPTAAPRCGYDGQAATRLAHIPQATNGKEPKGFWRHERQLE